MKNQRDNVHQYQKRITIITDRETAIAKACLQRGDKSKALLALRQKKFQESLLAKADAQLETLEQLIASVDYAQIQSDVMYGLKQGTTVLKQINAEMGGIDQVEKLMGENEEARAAQKEISDMLGGQLSNQDEDEVEDELEALEGEISGVKKPDAIDMPTAPKTELERQEKEEGKVERQKARARARAGEQPSTQASEPMLA